MQKWTTGVINLSKRDEALEGFRIALKKQDLALKSVKAEIEGWQTKKLNNNFSKEHQCKNTANFEKSL